MGRFFDSTLSVIILRYTFLDSLATCGAICECVLFGFYQRVSIASYANRWYSQRRNVRLSVCLSVCLSVRHTPVLYQNEESYDFFTVREPEHSSF